MLDERTIKLTLAYDGSRFHGWQRQKNGLTIQEILEDKIGMMTQEPICVVGSGRTDAGVHARAQVCHFRTHSTIPCEGFEKGLNSFLPEDIRVCRAEDVPAAFHARYSATSKVYAYQLLHRPEPDLFLRKTTWHVPGPLDLDAMRRCLARIEGEHDFSSFRSAGSTNRNPVRRVFHADLQGPDRGILTITLEANGFLRHMVRNIVGTLVDVGRGRIPEEAFPGILEARDRQKAGIKAPPGGLFLMAVRYGSDGESG
jgi:tRNA pseudouridine38-40 synthase